MLEHGGCSPKEAADKEAFSLIHRESGACVAAGSPAPAQMTEMPALRPNLLFLSAMNALLLFCDITVRLSSD